MQEIIRFEKIIRFFQKLRSKSIFIYCDGAFNTNAAHPIILID
jgi:hypothetical protein